MNAKASGDNNNAKISITDETKAVVESYLQKQLARRQKRLDKKKGNKPDDEWDPKTGKFKPRK